MENFIPIIKTFSNPGLAPLCRPCDFFLSCLGTDPETDYNIFYIIYFNRLTSVNKCYVVKTKKQLKYVAQNSIQF